MRLHGFVILFFALFVKTLVFTNFFWYNAKEYIYNTFKNKYNKIVLWRRKMFKQKEKKEKNENGKRGFHSKLIFGIIAIILIAIFCIAMTPVTLQNDTFYTIKIGEQITKTGIDMQDHFSWHEDLAYTYPHWLYDLITYEIYSAFGMTGIYVMTCILTVILGISLYIVNTKIAKNQLISFVLTAIVIYILRGYIAARAQLATFILFVWIIYFIEMFLQNRKIRYAVGLVLISTLIANLHVAVWPFIFVLFLPYIAEYVLAIIAEIAIYRKIKIKSLNLRIKLLTKSGKNVDKKQKLEEKLKTIIAKNEKIKIKREEELNHPYKIRFTKNKNVKWLVLIMIICAFTGLLTPLVETPYTYLYKTMQGNTTQNINEHLPMTIIDETEALATIVLILAILTFTKTKIKLSDLFMIAGLCYLMLASRRQVTMFCIIGVLIVNKMICGLLELYTKNGLEKVFKIVTTKVGYIFMICIMLLLSYHFYEPKQNDTYIDETAYPVQACDYILENIDLGTAKFYNEYNYGSYMIYRGIPVFIDSRADLYAPEFSGKKEDIFMDFIDTSSIGTFYEDTFEKYGITHVITYKNSKMNMIIKKTKDPNYKELYEDKYFTIYERLSV